MDENKNNSLTDNSRKDPLAWEEVSCEHIVKDEWIDFKRLSYRFPDGSIFEPYYCYSRKNYVVIVASDTDGNYLCVKQFRQGIKEVTTEFPAGGIERKDILQKMHFRLQNGNCLRKPDMNPMNGAISSLFPPMQPSQTITPISSGQKTAEE